ncbi:hypothetical protein OKW20_006075 [Ensifer sp. LBL]
MFPVLFTPNEQARRPNFATEPRIATRILPPAGPSLGMRRRRRQSDDRFAPVRLMASSGKDDGRVNSMAKATTKAKNNDVAEEAVSASSQIDARIAELGDWRGATLAQIRKLIKEADPDMVEEWKWRGVPVWEHAGIICTGETYKAVVKMTFAKGAALEDPAGLFNSSLEGNTRRAIDIHEGEAIDEEALKALVLAAVELNLSAQASRPGRPRNKV